MSALIVLCPHWGVHGNPSPEALGMAHQTLTERSRARLSRVAGDVLASDGEVLVAVVLEAAAAVEAALDLLALAGGEGVVGLGWGEVLVEAGAVHGVEAARARRIAWRGPPGRVLCTEAFREALRPVPPGIGLFHAGPDQAARVGFGVHEIADHRP